MAYIKKIKEGTETIYPATIPQAVVDPTSGKSVRTELDEKATSAELVQLAGDVNELGIKDAVQGAKIKDIENVISTMNPNQSAQLSVSGRKVVSLPKNASNGGMQVKLEGLTAENLVVNGDFRNGFNGWLKAETSDMATVVNGEVVYTAKQTVNAVSRIYQSINHIVGNKYYTRASVKRSDAGKGTQLRLGNHPESFTSTGNGYEILSAILTPVNTLSLSVYFNTLELDEVIYIDNVSTIDLTALFGAGNEPDLATCDAMFADYFEGVKSFVPTGRVRSVDKNGLNPTALYLTAPELRSNGVVKDEIRKGANGYELVKRISDTVILNGSEDWGIGTATLTNTISFGLTIAGIKDGGVNRSSFWENIRSGLSGNDAEAMQAYGSTLLIRINKTRLSTENISGFKSWLTANNQTLNYELDAPTITPISHGGVLNSAENGTVYHEPVIADAGVYGTNMPILLTDYPISALEEIIKHENGVDTYLNVASAVVASDGLSFTHPDLADGDLVLFTYAFDKESTNGNITATFYDSNVVKIDTVTGKAYKITDVVTNGVLTRTLTEV